MRKLWKREILNNLVKLGDNMIILGTGSYDNVLSGNTVSVTGDGGNAWNYFGPASSI